MSDKISPRPWKLKINEDGQYWIEDANEICICDAFHDENVEYFIKFVNEHDSLVKGIKFIEEQRQSIININQSLTKIVEKQEVELEKLKQKDDTMESKIESLENMTDFYVTSLSATIKENDRLNQKIKELREALKKCSPYVFIQCTPCKFCRIPEGNGHTEDCEYIKLTEDVK